MSRPPHVLTPAQRTALLHIQGGESEQVARAVKAWLFKSGLIEISETDHGDRLKLTPWGEKALRAKVRLDR